MQQAKYHQTLSSPKGNSGTIIWLLGAVPSTEKILFFRFIITVADDCPLERKKTTSAILLTKFGEVVLL
jgi:hypothetical protein